MGNQRSQRVDHLRHRNDYSRNTGDHFPCANSRFRDANNRFHNGNACFRLPHEFLRGSNSRFCRRENRRRGAGGSVPKPSTNQEVSMSPHVRPLAGFRNMADQQLVTTASAVVKEMTDNANFPNPPVDLKALATAVDDLSAAVAAQVQGGTASTAHKQNKRATVVDLLVKLAHYVHDNCGNNPAVVLSSGFQVAGTNRAKSPLSKPGIISIDAGKSTELVLKLSPVTNARVFDLEFAPLGANSTPGDWKAAGLFTNSRSITVGNLVPGTTYVFRVRAAGTTGYSDWSDPVAHMAT